MAYRTAPTKPAIELFDTTNWVNVAGAALLTVLGTAILTLGVVLLLEQVLGLGPTALWIVGTGVGATLAYVLPVLQLRSSCIQATFDPNERVVTIRRGPPAIGLRRRYDVKPARRILCESSTKSVLIRGHHRDVTTHLVTIEGEDMEPTPLGVHYATRPEALEVARRAAQALELDLDIADHGSQETVPYSPD